MNLPQCVRQNYKYIIMQGYVTSQHQCVRQSGFKLQRVSSHDLYIISQGDVTRQHFYIMMQLKEI